MRLSRCSSGLSWRPRSVVSRRRSMRTQKCLPSQIRNQIETQRDLDERSGQRRASTTRAPLPGSPPCHLIPLLFWPDLALRWPSWLASACFDLQRPVPTAQVLKLTAGFCAQHCGMSVFCSNFLMHCRPTCNLTNSASELSLLLMPLQTFECGTRSDCVRKPFLVKRDST